MLYVFYWNPYINCIQYEDIPSYLNPQDTIYHILKHGRLSIYSKCTGRSLIVKSCNLLILELSLDARSLDAICRILTELHYQHKLHSFCLNDYPELLV